MDETKQCARCHEFKPLGEFRNRAVEYNRPDGMTHENYILYLYAKSEHTTWCDECIAAFVAKVQAKCKENTERREKARIERETTKHCTICNKDKPFDQFHADYSFKGGRDFHCLQCVPDEERERTFRKKGSPDYMERELIAEARRREQDRINREQAAINEELAIINREVRSIRNKRMAIVFSPFIVLALVYVFLLGNTEVKEHTKTRTIMEQHLLNKQGPTNGYDPLAAYSGHGKPPVVQKKYTPNKQGPTDDSLAVYSGRWRPSTGE